MALPVYPDDVPYEPLRDSLSYEADYPCPAVTTMEDGAQDSRPVGLTTWTLSFSIPMTDAEYLDLEGFIVSIGNSSAPFMMPIWRPGDTFSSEGSAHPRRHCTAKEIPRWSPRSTIQNPREELALVAPCRI